MNDTQVRVAAVHLGAPYLDAGARTEFVCECVRRAAHAGAKLVVFPESYVPGFPYWICTSAPMRQKSALAIKLYENAIDLRGPYSRTIGEVARQCDVWVAVGLTERCGGTLYNTIAYYAPTGKLAAAHRKLQPTNAERSVWGRGDGADIFVLDTPFGRLSGLVCLEHTIDPAAYALAALHEQVHVSVWPAIDAVPANPNSAQFRRRSEILAASFAMRNQCFVIFAQDIISDDVLAVLGLDVENNEVRVGGGCAGVLSPSGEWVGEVEDSPGIVVRDLDFGLITAAKYFVDSSGHYARPDIFSFKVSRSRQVVLADADAFVIPVETAPVDRPDA